MGVVGPFERGMGGGERCELVAFAVNEFTAKEQSLPAQTRCAKAGVSEKRFHWV